MIEVGVATPLVGDYGDTWDPPTLAPPFDDAILFLPQTGTGDNFSDAVTDTPAVRAIGFGGLDVVGGDDVITSNAQGGIVCYGWLPGASSDDTDLSLHWRAALDSVSPMTIWQYGRLRLIVLDVGAGVHKFAAVKSFSGGSITAIGTTTIAADTEYDVYATWDRDTAMVAIIVDGTEEATEEDAANYVNTPNLPSFSAKLPPNSWCTELATWSAVVVVADPFALFVAEVMADSPLLRYDMDGAALPFENLGSLGSSANATTGAFSGFQGRVDPFGRDVADFSGATGEFFNDPGGFNLTANFTVETIAYVDDATVQRPIVNRHGGGSGSDQWYLGVNPSTGYPYGGIRTSTAYRTVIGSASIVGGWHHIVFTNDGTTLRLYIDGTEVATAAGGTAQTSLLNVTVGADNYIATPRLLNGAIAFVAAYSSLLSPTRIAAHFDAIP